MGTDIEKKCEDKLPLASLYLPHMPSELLSPPPTIRLLVCADIDLRSSAALCEFILQQRNMLFDAMTIDMVLVAGPLTSASDVGSFGINRRVSAEQQTTTATLADYPPYAQPYVEPPDKAAARLGMITACLSQLENIVCRVVYLMGTSDPLLRHQQRRLTPNSRNLNQQWLGIAPGLGCAGLNYIDDLENLLRALKEKQDKEGAEVSNSSGAHYFYALNNSSDSTSCSNVLSQRIADLPERKKNYSDSIEQLLKLSEQQQMPSHPYLQQQAGIVHQAPQTILATQHVRRDTLSSEQSSTKSDDKFNTSLGSTDDARVCFEVASGFIACQDDELPQEQARWIGPRLLYPGSLRERGDFVLVDVSLCKNDDGLLRWKMSSSQFLTLNNFRRND